MCNEESIMSNINRKRNKKFAMLSEINFHNQKGVALNINTDFILVRD